MTAAATAMMEILFLGTGTSHGVPMIGCQCATCTSGDEKNYRLRTSVLLTKGTTQIIIDTSVDFRQQCLKHRIHHLDAILFTHAHADHIFGLDDVRALNRLNPQKKIPCYASPKTINEIRQIFSYVFDYPDIPGGIPMIDLRTINGPFQIGDIAVEPLTVMHGNKPVLAFRFNRFVYITDCSHIPDTTWNQLTDVDTLALDCLRFRPHPTHFNYEQALTVIERIRPKRTYLIHLSHDIEHHTVSAMLPESVYLAYDGLRIIC